MSVFDELVAKRLAIKATRLGGASMAPDDWAAIRDCGWMIAVATLIGLVGLGAIKPVSIAAALRYYALGLVTWSIIEYISHRWTFHAIPKKLKYKTGFGVIHIPHHMLPHEGINAGPLTVYPFALVMLGINALASATFAGALLLTAGNLLGAMFYEYMHYEMHLGKRRFRYVRYMTSLHDYHHDHDWGVNFGVTNPFWDICLGTYKSPVVKESRVYDAN